MRERIFHRVSLAAVILVATMPLFSFQAQAVSSSDATGGLKEALTQGATNAVAKLGKADGFLKNRKVKIPLPDSLKKMEGLLHSIGMGRQADDLVVAMNRAAEAAVPEAKTLLHDAVRQMTVEDALTILKGGKTSATDYFRKKTEPDLTARFLPVVKKSTSKVALAEKYDAIAGRASGFGVVDKQDANIEEYVTRKALDGLYRIIGEEETAIRRNPLGQTSSLLRQVFGSLKR